MNKTKISIKFILFLALFMQPFAPALLQAGAPLKINFQGRLDESGQPVNASKTFIFNVYDALTNGTLIWTSQSQAIDVSNGVFSAVLSAGATEALSTGTFSGARYVAITVDGQLLSPRQEMVSAPYALVAQTLAPDAQLPASTITDGSVTDVKVLLTTAAITSGKFADDRIGITTGAFISAFNGADQLVQLNSSGNLSLSGSLGVGGGIGLSVKVITIADTTAGVYSLGANDSTVLVDGSANNSLGDAIEVHLPLAASCKGRIYTVKRIDDDSLYSNDILVLPVGLDTVDGQGSAGLAFDVSAQWSTLTVQSAGDVGGTGLWVVLSQY